MVRTVVIPSRFIAVNAAETRFIMSRLLRSGRVIIVEQILILIDVVGITEV